MARIVGAIVLVLSGPVAAADGVPGVALTPTRAWGTVFADQSVEFRVRVDAPRAWAGRLTWRLAAGQRTVVAREVAVAADPERPAVVPLVLPIPPVKDGAALALKLTATATEAGADRPAATWEKDVWVFPRDPFADRSEWLKELKLTVFDPPGKTAKALTGLNVPFEEQANPAALADLKGGVLVVGEGVSFGEHPGLAADLARAAGRGVAVLVLAPADGELVVPGVGAMDAPAELALRRDVVRRFDKRLDPDGWPPDGKAVAATLTVGPGKDGDAVGVVAAGKIGPGGWPWAEARFEGPGRWAFCGYGVVAAWDDGPTPRYLFARVLERLVATEPGAK